MQRPLTGIERVTAAHLREGIEAFLRFAKGRLWRDASHHERLQEQHAAVQLREVTRQRQQVESQVLSRGPSAVSANGAVQPTVSVDGFAEANTILQEAPKANDDWNMHPQQICEARRSSLAEMIGSLTALSASMKTAGRSPAPDPVDVIQADVILGQGLHVGELQGEAPVVIEVTNFLDVNGLKAQLAARLKEHGWM